MNDRSSLAPGKDSSFSAWLRVRVGTEDVHYGGGLVAGAFCLKLFGDLATELAIRSDGQEGLLRAYEEVEFLHPVRSGDYLEARAGSLGMGRTSRRYMFELWKVIAGSGGTEASILEAPVLVARAIGTAVVVPSERTATDHGSGSA